jgi:uncharacterized membrane protein
VFASWLACQLYAGRAAFLLVGAMLATSMSANVFFWIIPGQRKAVAQLKAGQPVDPIHGWRARQRSVHNTYFTLPVLFAMLSNHYGWLYSGENNWVVLVLMMLIGALIRQSFVARHKAIVQGKRVPWEFAGFGVAALAGLVVYLTPKPEADLPVIASNVPVTAPVDSAAAAGATARNVRFEQVKAIVAQRCAMCHSAAMASKGISFDSPDAIKRHAQQLYQQAVVLKLMPLNNATRITPDERNLIKRWYEEGAPTN